MLNAVAQHEASAAACREGLQRPCPESFGVFASHREYQEHLGLAFQAYSTANRMHLFR